MHEQGWQQEGHRPRRTLFRRVSPSAAGLLAAAAGPFKSLISGGVVACWTTCPAAAIGAAVLLSSASAPVSAATACGASSALPGAAPVAVPAAAASAASPVPFALVGGAAASLGASAAMSLPAAAAHLPLQKLPLMPCKWLLVWFHQQTPVACRLWQACRQLRPRLCLQQLYLPPCQWLLVA